MNAQNYLIDAASRRWVVRRTCVDIPGRAYHALLADNIDDRADILPGVIGFYTATIDEIRNRLGLD